MIHEEDDKKQTRRRWKTLGGLAALLLLSTAAIFFMDDALEDASALAPHFTPGGGPENGLAVFTREILAQPVEGYLKLPKEVKEKRPGTEGTMRVFVDKQAKSRRAFDRLMASDPASWRWPDVEHNLTITANASYLTKMQELANTQSLLVHALAHEGKPAEAATEALRIAKCGNGMLRAEGGLSHWMLAITVQHIGEVALESALAGPAVTPDLVRSAQDELARADVRPLDFGFSYKVHVVTFRYMFLDLRSSGISLRAYGLSEAQALLVKPHRTINAHQTTLKPLIVALEHADWSELALKTESLNMTSHALLAHTGGFQSFSNLTGNKVLSSTLWGFGGLNRRALAAVAFHRQTLIMLAMRRFELEKGKFTASLDELVPQYLASVPQDPFDNAPMRWNATKTIIYSIGANLKDDGGKMEKYGRDAEPDIGLRYWWAPSETK